jgi:hypothetical protein
MIFMTLLTEAQDILFSFGFDKKRTNEASARTLLALAGIKEGVEWSSATNRRKGVRAILDWMRNELDHPIAENSRETIRRQVLHQFVDAGFCLYNDDDPERPTNSSKNNYRLTDDVLEIIHRYGTSEFSVMISEYLKQAPGLAKKYQAERNLKRLPIVLPNGVELTLKAGGQNALIKSMLDDFCPYFVPGGEVIYIGDADSKYLHFDEKLLADLGVVVDRHGKLPDLVVYCREKNWLFLMEAASTHGPVDAKRYGELSELFGNSLAGLVYVSCFPTRDIMRKFLADLAWETEVWVASDPTHMIHFDGERFLGPYSS